MKTLGKLTTLFAVAAMLAASSCEKPIEPRILTFNFKGTIDPPSVVDQKIADLTSGVLDIAEEIPEDSCPFLGDFTPFGPNTPPNTTGITTQIFGDPGDVGYTINAQSVETFNAHEDATIRRCGNFTAISFSAGRPSVAWGVGGEVDGQHLNFTLNGNEYTSRYFRARLVGVSSSGYASGEFDFVARNASGHSIFGTGSFALKD